MSWMLWCQIAGLIVITGLMARHVLEAQRRSCVITGVMPLPECRHTVAEKVRL